MQTPTTYYYSDRMIHIPEIEERSDVNLSDLFVVIFSYAFGLGAEDERTNN